MSLEKQKAQRKIDKFFASKDEHWLQTTVAVLGNAEGVVLSTETEGLIYARLRSGEVKEVYNDVVPDEPDIRVKIGRTKDQPDLWRVIARRESYSIPQAPRIKHHHKQHEFIDAEPGPDTTWIGTKAIFSLTVFVLSEDDQENFIVTIIGDIVEIPTGYAEVSSQTLDLSSHIPAVGARYVTLQFNSSGVVSVVDGTAVAAPELLTLDAVPSADTDKYAFAYVELHSDQEKLLNKHIRLIRKFFSGGLASISIVWGNITGTLSDQTDLQGELDGKSDTDHTHEEIEEFPTPHEHAITRWAADGTTTYTFPDYVSQIESVTLNGLEEDPNVYSLSSDGSQIVFDSAVTAGTVIVAHYLPTVLE